MKKSKPNSILPWLLFVSVIIMSGCNKEYIDNTQSQSSQNSTVNPKDTSLNSSLKDTCSNPSAKGRIIGFNPVMSFLNFDSSRFVRYDTTLGPGYLIEIQNGDVKDTVISYKITTNQFQYKPLKQDIASLYLFKQSYQDSLKIKFNYQVKTDKTEIKPVAFVIADGVIFNTWFKFIENRKEIIMNCVSHQ